MMKQTTRFTAVASLYVSAVFLFMFNSCKPETNGELGEPFDKVEGMIGTWELQAFTQQDLNSPIKETRDLSDFYLDGIATPLQITFDANRDYAVAIELGKNYFGEGGTWGFDDDLYPSYLQLYTATDTLEYNLGGMVRTFDQFMRIEYRRDCNTAPTNIYTFEFNRIN